MLSLNSVILRSFTADDQELVRTWRNADHVRKYMYTDYIITPEEHAHWYKSISKRNDCEYMIAEHEGLSKGVVAIYDIEKVNGTCF